MALVQSYLNLASDVGFCPDIIEQLILEIADEFHICLVWNQDTAIITGVMALAGTLIGGYTGGRVGAVVGTCIAGVTGFGISTLVSLREIWSKVKENLIELFYIVYNFLQRIHPDNYKRAIEILIRGAASKRELVIAILEFIAEKLGSHVISSIAQ